jgi:hypothetical protein
VIARNIYGVRSLVDVELIRAFVPTHVITLLDDVYLGWWRTQRRAGDLAYIGQPTPLQLLDARHAELLVGDLICRHLKLCRGRSIPNWLVATRHPARVLNRLLFSEPERLLPIYLSFPISDPRRLASNGDSSGVREVNAFLQQAAAVERQNPRVVCFCPVTIDELPWLACLRDGSQPDEDVVFETSNRWNVADFYGNTEILMAEGQPTQIMIKDSELRASEGMIRGDVAVRDYRLIKQSQRIVVFNPCFQGNLSSGVDNEITFALSLYLPVHIYQDPTHDPAGAARQRYKGQVGSLGGRPLSDRVTFHDSITEAFEAALR